MRASLTSLAILSLAASSVAQATRWVSPFGSNGNTGTFASPLLTINHANAISTAGDTIRLKAETFGNEQGTIILGDKDIAVIGSGVGLTVVKAHTTFTTNINTGFVGSPVATQQRAVMLIQGSGNVDLRAMTIDGNNAVPASGRLTGVYFRNGANGLVENCEITNCSASPLDGGQGSAGVVVRGDNLGDACDVTLRDVHLHHWAKVGAAVFFNASLTVQDSRVVGADHTVNGPAQVGIQIAYDASGFVHRTTIADIFYDPAVAVAAGILAFDAADDLVIEDNGIANCEHAIYVYGGVNTSIDGSIRRNRVVACDAGVYLDNISGVDVIDNHLQLSLDLFANSAFDNLAGNSWSTNNYSSYPGVGSYVIPGTAGAVDLTPRRGVDLFTAPATTSLPVGHAGRALVTAQLNGAGGSDFATVDENAGLSVTVGLNTGGGFTTTNIPFALSGQTIGIVAAELNGSAGLDLAVLIRVTTPAAGATVFTFANNGSGVFTQIGAHFLTAVTPTGLAAGELTGDAVDDLVVGRSTTSALLLKNQAVFGTNYLATALPSAGFFPSVVRGVAVAEMTGDAFNDVLIAEGTVSIGRVWVLANNGAGTFTATGSSPYTIGVDPTGIVGSDLDGDGDRDVLASFGTLVNSTPGGVAVLENLGGGSFRQSSYNTDYSSSAVAAGNLDNDTTPDLRRFGDAAIVNNTGGTVTVLGGFVKGAGFSHGGIAANLTQPTAVSFGDFDGDAYQDLFYTNGLFGGVVVLPGRPSARTDHYGFSSEGFFSKIPYVAPVGAPGVPTQPNLTLGVELSNGRPFTLAAIVGSLAPAAVLAPNDLQFDMGGIFVVYLLVTDTDGRGTMPFGLPAAPSIKGLPLYFQGGVFDLVGGYIAFPGISLSRGLKLRVGN